MSGFDEFVCNRLRPTTQPHIESMPSNPVEAYWAGHTAGVKDARAALLAQLDELLKHAENLRLSADPVGATIDYIRIIIEGGATP